MVFVNMEALELRLLAGSQALEIRGAALLMLARHFLGDRLLQLSYGLLKLANLPVTLSGSNRRVRLLLCRLRLKCLKFLLAGRLLIGRIQRRDDVVVARSSTIAGAVALVPLAQEPVERVRFG